MVTREIQKHSPAVANLSDQDREAAINRLYDVALDPTRYEALLDLWETAVSPLRAGVDFKAPRLLDDPLIAAHFRRASEFLDRIEIDGRPDDLHSILAPFDKVAAFVLDSGVIVRAANDTANTRLGLKRGDSLQALPVVPEDIEAVRRTVYSLLSDAAEDTALLRVRSREKGNFIVLRLQRCETADRAPMVLAASNEVGWPAKFPDLLRSAFGLTGAETDVVHGLVDCASVTEIAEKRGRSIDTIRVQIKSILAKTETHSQVELVRLALSLMDMANLTIESAAGPRVVSRGYETLEERSYHSLVTDDGRRLDYLVLGHPSGKPLLFLPLDYGLVRWPSSAEAEATRRGMKIIVPVRAGYGLSDPLPKPAEYDAAMIADTLQVLDAENVQSCPILSMGSDSFYAFRLTLSQPHRFTAIVACAGVLPMTRREQFERMDKWHRFILAGAKYTPHLLPFMVKAGFLLARKIGKRGFVHAVYGDCPADVSTFEHPEVFEAMVTGSETALSESHSAHEAFSRMLLGGQRDDWSDDVTALRGTLPVVFVNGADDPQVPLDTLREFQADFDWIDYQVHDDAGQLVFFRHWRDVLNILTPYLTN